MPVIVEHRSAGGRIRLGSTVGGARLCGPPFVSFRVDFWWLFGVVRGLLGVVWDRLGTVWDVEGLLDKTSNARHARDMAYGVFFSPF